MGKLSLTDKGKELLLSNFGHEDEYDFPTVDELENTAKNQSCRLIRSTSFTLLVDLDTDDAVKQFNNSLDLLNDRFGIEKIEAWTSRSGKHQHRVVHVMENLTPLHRVALEVTLGSDVRRGMLSVSEFLKGRDEVSFLYQPLDAVVTVEEF